MILRIQLKHSQVHGLQPPLRATRHASSCRDAPKSGVERWQMKQRNNPAEHRRAINEGYGKLLVDGGPWLDTGSDPSGRAAPRLPFSRVAS